MYNTGMRKTLIAFLLMPQFALADGFINGVPVDCYCTDQSGQRVEVGESICLQVDGRMFMAQCQMSLNVPIWREVSEGCLSSSLIGGQSRDPSVNTGSVGTIVPASKS